MFSNSTKQGLQFARFNATIGRFVIDADENTPNAVKVVVNEKSGRTRWQLRFDQLDGILTSVKWVEDTDPNGNPKFVARLRFKSLGDDSDCLLSCNLAVGCVVKMLGALNATDLSTQVRLKASHFAKGSSISGGEPLESDQSFLNVFNEKGYVTPSYPNGLTALPKTKEVRVGNRIVPDSSEREEIGKKICEILQAKTTAIHRRQQNDEPTPPPSYDDDTPPVSSYATDANQVPV